jgi:hypothetical protein
VSEPQVIVTSLNQDVADAFSIGGGSWLGAVAQQVRFLAPTTVNSVKIRLSRNVDQTGPTGTLSVKIYVCEGGFRSIDSKPTGAAIATSTNTLNAQDLTTDWMGENYDFTFDNIEFAAGFYFLSIEISENAGDGQINVLACGDGWETWLVPNLGAGAFFNDEQGWMSMHQYD